MRKETSLRFIILLNGILALTTVSAGAAPLKALIVDGQNNHNWQGTTPVLKTILEEEGRFTVDVATSPAKGQPMDGFKPAFANYDVVVSNYTGDSWPRATEEALERYMKNGGGLVIFHAADNAFPKWDEWNKMIALGGWGGRNEKSGPMIRYRDGKVIRDTSPGRGGTHGPQHAFQVVLRNTDHPITRGLPTKWMHVKDELYSKLRGPAENMTLLATAYADPQQKGTGEHEPVLFTIDYHKGHVFHTVLGHGPEQLKCVCCITLLQRGAEWAATGRVTGKVPDDFPTADAVSIRMTSMGDYKAIVTYDFGQSRHALARIEAAIRQAKPRAYPGIEAQLLAALNAPQTRVAGKQFCCRMLRRVGSAASVPSLSKLLADEELSHMARFALQHMPAPEAGRALRRALKKLQGNLRTGVIGSLGLRGDRQAVQGLGRLIENPDQAIAKAAIQALGRIGGPEAVRVLTRMQVVDKLTEAKNDAILLCADAMLAEGQNAEAVAIYRRLSGPEQSTWIRIAAYRGLVRAEPREAVPHVLALLRDENIHLQRAAGKFITQMQGAAVTRALAGQMKSLDSQAQILLLSALETRADKAATPYVVTATQTPAEPVRVAAVKALGSLGRGEQVELLAKLSVSAGAVGSAAVASLNRLAGSDVTGALATLVRGDADAEVRIKAIEACERRHETETVSALMTATRDRDSRVRRASYKALGTLAQAGDMPFLVSRLAAAEQTSDRTALERTMILVAGRDPIVDPSALLSALQRGNDTVKTHLFSVLAVVGGADALNAIRGYLDAPNAEVQKAAIRALSKWPNDLPMIDLLKIARRGDNASQRILALRGYIQLVSQPNNRSAKETVAALSQAYDAAQRIDEKRMVLSLLSKYPSQDALALAARAETESALAREAGVAKKMIEEILRKRKLSAQASRNNGNAKNALDGRVQTRWDTGRPMKPGDWFVLDLGLESTVKGLTLDTRNSRNDFPRGYEIYVSFGGGNWGKPILKGKGTEPITEIRFKEPVNTRYIKILQTGSHNAWHWSIHTLQVEYEE